MLKTSKRGATKVLNDDCMERNKVGDLATRNRASWVVDHYVGVKDRYWALHHQ